MLRVAQGTITLVRMFSKGPACRAPVLLARTGLEMLFAHLRDALAADGAEAFDDYTQLYQWLRCMLLDPVAAHTLVLFMDCLCRFAELRRRLVGQLKHDDRLDAIAGSADATNRSYVEAVLLVHKLELLYRLAALPQDYYGLGQVVIRLMIPIWTHATSVTKLTIDLPMASWMTFCNSLKGATPALAPSLLGVGSASARLSIGCNVSPSLRRRQNLPRRYKWTTRLRWAVHRLDHGGGPGPSGSAPRALS